MPPIREPSEFGFLDHNPRAMRPRLAVKDMIAVKGLRQTAGIALHAERRAARDAAIVARMRAAGYAIAGTTLTDAAGFGTLTNALANPIDPARAVGGSSGGAAAAVAAGLAEAGLGTDTGGSVRIPAAYCDLHAFKASHGRLPMEGVIALSPAFDSLGVLAASAAALTEAATALLSAPPAPGAPLAFAIDEDALAAATPGIAAAFLAAAERLGITRTVRGLPAWEQISAAHGLIVCADAAEHYGPDVERHRTQMPPALCAAVEAVRDTRPEALAVARRVCERARNSLREVLDGTILCAPTLPMPAQPRFTRSVLLEGRRQPVVNANIRLTLQASVAGAPAVVVPFAGGSLHFTGPAGSDEALLCAVLQRIEALAGAPL